MVEIPRAKSTGQLTTQTTAPEIRDITSFTKTTQAGKEFGNQLAKIGLTFREREKDRESTLAKIEYQKFLAETKEEFSDPTNLTENSRSEFIGVMNGKRKELMGTISRDSDRDEFLLSTGSSTFQAGAVVSTAARSQIQKNQKSSFIEFKEGKIQEFLETPITNDLKAASMITELEVERGKLDINGYLSDAERTDATGNFSIEGIKNEVINKKITHDMDSNLADARDNLVNRRYGLEETDRETKIKEVDKMIEGNLNAAQIQIMELQNEGSIKQHRDLRQGKTNLTDIDKRWKEGKLSDIERDLYRDIWIGKNVGAVPEFKASARFKADRKTEFFNLGFTPVKPDDVGKPLTKKDLEKAGKRATLEGVVQYRQNILRGELEGHYSEGQAQQKLDEIELVLASLTDDRAKAIINSERAAFKEMENWIDKNVGDITQGELKSQVVDLIRDRMDDDINAEIIAPLIEDTEKLLGLFGTGKKFKSPEIIQDIWLRNRERYLRETNPSLSNIKNLPNTYFDGQKERNISFDTSEAKATRKVSGKEVKKSSSATEKMIRAIQKEGVTKGLEELRNNPQRAEQLGIDVDAVFNRFKQER